MVDEVDDSRVTLEYCLNERRSRHQPIGRGRIARKTQGQKGTLPANLPYFSGITVEDWWINYPWDALDLAAHNSEAANGNHHSEINNTNSTK